MPTPAELREQYPDVFGDKSDFDMVNMYSQALGKSPVYAAWKLGLPLADYVQNKSNSEDFKDDLKIGGAEAARGGVGLLNIAAAPFTDEQLITTPGLDEYIQRKQATMSPNRQRAQGELDQAWEDGGFWNILGEYASEPAYLTGMGLQSAPAMVGGGVGGMALRGAARLGTGALARGLGAAAPYIGEGAIAGGMDYAQMVEQGVDPQVAAGYGALAGAGVGALGGVGGAFANRMGITDVSRALSGARRVDGDVPLSYGRQLGYGSLNEAGQEILQSPWEQAMQNLATDQPVTEGLARSAVEGGILGGVMGAGFNAMPRGRGRELDLTQDRDNTQGLVNPAQPFAGVPGGNTTPESPQARRQADLEAAFGAADQNLGLSSGHFDANLGRELTLGELPSEVYDTKLGRNLTHAELITNPDYQGTVAKPTAPKAAAAPKASPPENPTLAALRQRYADNPTWPTKGLLSTKGAVLPGFAKTRLPALQVIIGQNTPEEAIKRLRVEQDAVNQRKGDLAPHVSRLIDVLIAEQEAKLASQGQTTSAKADTAGTVPEGNGLAPQAKTTSVMPAQETPAPAAPQDALGEFPPYPGPAAETGTSLADLAARNQPKPKAATAEKDLTKDAAPTGTEGLIADAAQAEALPTTQAPKQTNQKLVIDDADADHQARFDATLDQVATKRNIPAPARAALADLMQRYFRIGKYHEYSGVQPPSYTSMAAALNDSGYAVSHTTAGILAKEFQDLYAAELERQGKPVEYFDPQAMAWTGTLDDGNQRGTRNIGTVGAEEFDAAQGYGRDELVDAEQGVDGLGDVSSEADAVLATGTDDLGQFGNARSGDAALNAIGEADATANDPQDDADIDEELGYQLGGIGSKADAAAGGIGGADAVSARPRVVKFYADRHLFAANKYREARGEPPLTPKEAKAELSKLSDVALGRHLDRLTKAGISGKRLADVNDPKPKLVDAYAALQDDLAALGTGALRGEKSGRTVVELETPDTSVAVSGAVGAWQQATRSIPNAPALDTLSPELLTLWEKAHNGALELPDFHREAWLRNFARDLINERDTQSKRGVVAGTAAQPQASDAAGTAPRPTDAENLSESGGAQPELATGGRETQAPAGDVVIGDKDASGVAIRTKKRRVVQQGQAASPTTATTGGKLRQVIRGLLGTDEHWRVNIYETAQEAKAAGLDVPDTAYGWVDVDRKGVKHAYFIAERIQAGTELGKFLHEVGAHIGIENILSNQQMALLHGKIKQWAEANDGSVESKAAKLALARVAESGVTELDDQRSEGIAYFLEELVEAGVNPMALNTSTALGRWFRTLWAAFKVALRKLRVQNLDRLTGQDVVDLAYGAARLDLNTRWHGTAAKFRKFNSAYMSTGAGGQWYSWGHYVAKRSGVGNHYMDMAVRDKATPPGLLFGGKPAIDAFDEGSTGLSVTLDLVAEFYQTSKPRLNSIIMRTLKEYREDLQAMEEVLASGEPMTPDQVEIVTKSANSWREQIKWLEANQAKFTVGGGKPEGSLFNVDVDARPEEIMHWDLPFSEQPEYVQQRLQEAMFNDELPVPGENATTRALFDGKPVPLGHPGDGALAELEHWYAIKLRKGGPAPSVADLVAARLLNYESNLKFYAKDENLRDPDMVAHAKDTRARKAWLEQNADRITFGKSANEAVEITDDTTGQEIMQRLVASLQGKSQARADGVNGNHYSSPEGKAASLYLDSLGIKGMEHFDEPSRSGKVPENQRTTNLVVFNDKNIYRVARGPDGKIAPGKRQFGQETPAARQRRGTDDTVPAFKNAQGWLKQEFKSGKAVGEGRGLGWLTMEQIAERYGDQVPALRAINTAIGTMEAQAKKWVGKAEHIDRLWQQLSKAQDKLMSEIMIAATLAGYDPDGGKTKTKGVTTPEEAALDRQWQHLQALDKGAKVPATSVYRAVRNHFEQDLGEVKAHLKALKGQEKTPQVEALIGALEGLSKGSTKPYFPLMRLGGYYTVGRSPELQALHVKRGANDDGLSKDEEKRYEALRKDAKHYVVASHARLANAERHRDKLLAQGMTAFANTAQERGAKHRSSIVEDMKTFDNAIKDINLDAGVKKQLEQVYESLLISSLPEGHVLKKSLRRDGVIGADTDMRRVVATSANSRAYALSRLQHARDVQESLGELRAASADGNMTERNLANEMVRRTNLAYEHYQDSPIITAMTTASYMGMLGASPAFWLINLTQVPLITAPWLAARTNKGFTATMRDLGVAAKQASQMIKWTTDGQWRAEFKLDNPPKGVTADEIKMFRALEDAGQLDFTLAFDLGQVAAGKSGKFWNALRSVNAPTNATELINRGGTALAAYRAKRGQGVDHDAAVEFAKQATNTTQINYNPANAARYMQTAFGLGRGPAKIMFQFYTYQQGMAYLALSTLKDAVAGDKTAMKTMGYMTGTLVAMSGVFGLPFVSTLLSAASMALTKLGDDDEPVDLEVWLKNLMHDTIPGLDVLASKGAPAALLGVDLSSRTGQGNLMNPLAYARFGAKDRGEDTIQELMFRIFGGASAGTASGIVDGAKAIAEGDLLKGIEKIGPLKAVKDLAKFAQLQEGGVRTGSGEQALGAEAFHAGNLLAQAMGFSPTKKSLYYEGNAAVQNVKQAVDGVRTKLLSRYAQAFIAGKGFTEVHKEIREFNQRHPERKISWTSMTQSVKQRRTNRQERLSSGVAGGKDNQPFQQYGRFAQ